MENIDILELSEIPICPPPTELANLEVLVFYFTIV